MSVGLGSDISGGYSLSIQSAMRQAVITARSREGQRRELKVFPEDRTLRIDWIESLYLATRGGAFEVGMEFDAQLSECDPKPSFLSGGSSAGQ